MDTRPMASQEVRLNKLKLSDIMKMSLIKFMKL